MLSITLFVFPSKITSPSFISVGKNLSDRTIRTDSILLPSGYSHVRLMIFPIGVALKFKIFILFKEYIDLPPDVAPALVSVPDVETIAAEYC